MSYAGMYDPTPVPEPKNKPLIRVVVACGSEVWADPVWVSDPLYGGWKPPGFTHCPDHGSEFVRAEAWPPKRKSRGAVARDGEA